MKLRIGAEWTSKVIIISRTKGEIHVFNQVSILLPYKEQDGIRDAERKWLTRYYKKFMPDAELCFGENSDENFNRSKAINAAAKKATRNIYVMSECDVVYDPNLIIEAIGLLKKAAWIIPFNRVLNISQVKTEEILQLEPDWPLPSKLEGHAKDHYPMTNLFAGKMNIFSREAFEKVGGFDERFIGWGREDDAFLIAMNTICGPFTRMKRTIYHFWHPFVGAHNNPNIKSNNKLLLAYRDANGNRTAMKQLIRSNKKNAD